MSSVDEVAGNRAVLSCQLGCLVQRSQPEGLVHLMTFGRPLPHVCSGLHDTILNKSAKFKVCCIQASRLYIYIQQ